MKKLLGLGLIFALTAMMVSCGPKTVPVDETPVIVDTTPPPPPPPPVDTTPPEPEVRTISEGEFQTVYFDFDKSSIKPNFSSALESNADLMKESMDMIIQIEGHCDERGTVEYNLALGERRAMATRSYLVNLGVAAERIEIISYGKERPAMMGHNEAAWSKNRRTEFRIISQ